MARIKPRPVAGFFVCGMMGRFEEWLIDLVFVF